MGLKGGRNRRYTVAERLASRIVVDPATGCWNVQGCRIGPNGYAQIFLHRTPEGKPKFGYAHRVAWELTRGPIPDGFEVCHACDNPRCARVAVGHLFLGTHQENIADSVRKGRFTAHHRTGVRLNGQFSKRKRRLVFERVPFIHVEVRGEVA